MTPPPAAAPPRIDASSGVAVFPRSDTDLSVPAIDATTDTDGTPKSGENSTGNSDGASGSERKPFLYASLPDWYTAWLAKTIERRLDAAGTGTLTWCPQWWAHPEVNARLEALWRAWEVARHQDGDAPTRWFAQLDANLKVLMDAKLGPMADCGPDTHRRYANTRPLPGTPAPPGWWGAAADATHAGGSANARFVDN